MASKGRTATKLRGHRSLKCTGGKKYISDIGRRKLSFAKLGKADLNSTAELVAANLIGSCLFGANLRPVHLVEPNLRGADLYRANLSGATSEPRNSAVKCSKSLTCLLSLGN